MNNLNIYCDEYDFSALSVAFGGEFSADCPLSVEIVFMDKQQIKELNAKSRGVDKPTDVLSFPTLEGILGKNIKKRNFPFDVDEDGALCIGSIVICREVAREQAEEYGHSYERELFYLAAHGVCHLLGYDHAEEEDKKLMRALEERVMQRLKLTRCP